MRAALYARVSDEEQVEGYILDAQKRAFRAYAESQGWDIYHEYVDEGVSAHTDDVATRPLFRQMIEDALARRYDVLVVHKLDRFARTHVSPWSTWRSWRKPVWVSCPSPSRWTSPHL